MCILLTVAFVVGFCFFFYPEHGTLDSVCLIQNEAWNLASSLIGGDEQMGWGETGRLLQRMKLYPPG